MIRAVICDIDGTLIDSMPIWDDLGARYLRSLGVEPEPGLGDILFTMTIQEGVHYCKERYELSQSEEEIRESLNKIVEDFYRFEVPLKEGAAQMLAYFKSMDIPMTLASIGEPTLVKAALERLGVWDCFREMLICEDLHTTKKEPLVYLTAAEHMGVRPEETLVFEDVHQAVHSAKSAGFKVCAIKDPASSKDWKRIEAEADLMVENFSELNKVIALAQQ